LTVIKKSEKTDNQNRPMWECQCSCGNTIVVNSTILRARNRQSCGCFANELSSQRKGKNHPSFTGFEELPGHFFSSIRCRARNRHIEFNVTPKQLWELYIKQNKKCALSGIFLQFHSGKYTKDGNASLDRIDSGRDYTMDNVQWVDKKVNFMKQASDERDFIKYCQFVASHNQQEPEYSI
jgi:hypothetical protein